MDTLGALILSIVEGISEFLPISSTGHLIIAANILKIAQTNFVKDFEIIIQLGAILAIVVLYFNKFLKSTLIWKKVLTAFLPTAVIGFILFKFIKSFLLGNLYITLASLLIGGVILIILELIYKEKDHHAENIEDISFKNAFLIGIFQSIAVIPGVSRSAATIVSALFLGTKRKAAAEFSFLLAVPTMLAASSLDLVKSNFSYTGFEWLMLGIGFLGAFVSALVVVKWFLKYIQSHTFVPFGIYRIIVSLIFWYILVR
jgi:undecaprenyl-diphosphatase